MAITIRDTGNNIPTNQQLIIEQDALLEYNITSDNPIEEVDVSGLLRPFYHDWNQNTGKLKIIGRPGSIEELDVMIKVKDENGNTESAGFHLSVTNVRPIIVDPGTLIFNQGLNHEFPITIHNFPSAVEVRGTWLGLEAFQEPPGVILRGSLPGVSTATLGKRKGEFEIIATNSSPQRDRKLVDWKIRDLEIITGQFEIISDRNFGLRTSHPNDLAFSTRDDKLYMLQLATGGDRGIHQMNKETGNSEGVINNAYSIAVLPFAQGLTIDNNNHIMYVVDRTVDALFALHHPYTEGNFVRIGSSRKFGVNEDIPASLAYDTKRNKLLMWGRTTYNLYELNTTSGAATATGLSTSFRNAARGTSVITYNPNDDLLYIANETTDILYTLSPPYNGTPTRLGNYTRFDVNINTPYGLTVDPLRNYLYLVGFGLKRMARSPVST